MSTAVWTYPERKFEKLGAVRWQATWEEVKKSAQSKEDIDPDLDIDYRCANFATKEKALAYARKIVDSYRTAYGQVTVTRQVVDWYVEEDRIAEWVNTSEEEHVD